jgi:protease IV
MSFDAESLVERRLLKRKVSFWRVFAVLGLIAAFTAVGLRWSGRGGIAGGQTHIARIGVEGFIGGERKTLELMDKVRDNKSIAAIIVHINSPGGTTTGSEALYKELRRLNEKKPVIAFVDGVAASGGYIAAMGAERIVARETALVGSIGVLFQFPNVNGLLNTVGVKVEEIKSSPLKAAPNGFEPTSPEARAALQQVVNETYGWFKEMVANRRNLDAASLALVSDGRVYGGRSALALKLIDQIGTERDAVIWLETEKAVAKNLPIKDWKPREDFESLDFWTASAQGLRWIGFHKAANLFQHSAPRVQLDGLLALWQPALNK